ncbi:MAG TPA: homoserine kinase [Vicinamibacterales bacterium]|nr:homoserine kinase [Vicinamibacterales bacterium]
MIAAFAPATVSNVACGFDVLGFPLDAPGDLVIAEARAEVGVEIVAIAGDAGRLSRDPQRNTAGAAVLTFLDRIGAARGIRLTLHKGLPLASGVGSSAASAVAALVATNELLGRPAPLDLLLQCAMAGEGAGCGAEHPDNVAPALYGGFVLARAAHPPDIIRLPCPPGLACAVLHPHLEIETAAARALLGGSVALADAVRQWGNLGALVAGLYTSDLALISRSLEDHIAEPKRAHLVPGFHAVKQAARVAGALGCSLSGAGPSMFALCHSLEVATGVGEAMQRAFATVAPAVDADLWVSPIGRGARLVTA